MQLTWYGTAGLILQEEHISIAFDPFCGISRHTVDDPEHGPGYGPELRNVSHVFVTHGHLDHIYHIPWLYQRVPVTIHCTTTPKKTLIRRGLSPEKIEEISPGYEGLFGPFRIRAWQSRHCVFDGPLLIRTIFSMRFWRHPRYLARLLGIHLSCPENKEILFYEVTCHGLRIQILGSMNLDAHTDYPTGADVLILPLQGRSDQDTYALKLIERLKPGSILLDHYDDTFPPLSSQADTSGFIENVQNKFGIPCQPLELKKGVTIYGRE